MRMMCYATIVAMSLVGVPECVVAQVNVPAAAEQGAVSQAQMPADYEGELAELSRRLERAARMHG